MKLDALIDVVRNEKSCFGYSAKPLISFGTNTGRSVEELDKMIEQYIDEFMLMTEKQRAVHYHGWMSNLLFVLGNGSNEQYLK